MTLTWKPRRRRRRWGGVSRTTPTAKPKLTPQQLQVIEERERALSQGGGGVLLPGFDMDLEGNLIAGPSTELTSKIMAQDRAIMEAELKKSSPDVAFIKELEDRLGQYQRDIQATKGYYQEKLAAARSRELIKRNTILQRLEAAGAIDAEGNIDLVKAGASGVTDAELALLGIAPPKGAPKGATPIGLAREANVRRRQAQSQKAVVAKLEAASAVTEGKVDLQAAMSAGITADELATIGVMVPETLQPARPTTQGQPQTRIPKTTTNVLVRLYPEAFGDVGSAEDIDAAAAMLLRQLATLIDADPVAFLQDLMDRGQTTETMELLAMLGATPQDIQEIMGAADAQDAMDALISKALPGYDAETVQELIETDEEAFVELITAGGRNDQKEELLAAIGLSQEEIDGLFPSARRFGGHAVEDDLIETLATDYGFTPEQRKLLAKQGLAPMFASIPRDEQERIKQFLELRQRPNVLAEALNAAVGPLQTGILEPMAGLLHTLLEKATPTRPAVEVKWDTIDLGKALTSLPSPTLSPVKVEPTIWEEAEKMPGGFIWFNLGEAWRQADIPGPYRFMMEALVDVTNLLPGGGFLKMGAKKALTEIAEAAAKTVSKAEIKAATKTLDDLATMGTRPVTEGALSAERAAKIPARIVLTPEAAAKVTPAVTTEKVATVLRDAQRTDARAYVTIPELAKSMGLTKTSKDFSRVIHELIQSGDVSIVGGRPLPGKSVYYNRATRMLSNKPIEMSDDIVLGLQWNRENLYGRPRIGTIGSTGVPESAAAKVEPAVPAKAVEPATDVKAIAEQLRVTAQHDIGPPYPEPPNAQLGRFRVVTMADTPDMLSLGLNDIEGRQWSATITNASKPNAELTFAREADVGRRLRGLGTKREFATRTTDAPLTVGELRTLAAVVAEMRPNIKTLSGVRATVGHPKVTQVFDLNRMRQEAVKGAVPAKVAPRVEPAVPVGQARAASAEVRAIQEAGKVAPEKVAPEKATFAHVESAAPDGPKPPKPPGPAAKAGDPDDIAREIAEKATPGETPNQTLLRRHEAAVSNEQRRVGIVIREGNEKLKGLGVGVTRRGQLVPNEADIPKLDELFNALHNPSKVASGEVKVPEGFEDVYNELRGLTDWEQAARLDFDPKMATVQDYFYRGWKPPEGAFANVSQGKPLVRTPAFKKLRAEATYAEMREAGFEPLFWNPYQQWGISRMQGVKYREQMVLVEMLKGMGDDFVRPHAGGPVPDGWRVPEVGPAFEGKPFATADGAGEPMVMYTRRWITPDSVANTLENIYGKRPDIGKVVVAGKVLDPLKVVDWLTFLPKRAKLFGSFFQQIDFLTRAGAGAWTMMVDSLLAGKPISAVMAMARLPKTVVTMIGSNFSPSLRLSLAKQLDGTVPLVKGRPGLTMKSITEAGLSTIDPAMLNWSEMDKIIGVVKEEAKLAGKFKKIPGAIGELESMMRRGLFEGVYPAALITDITNNMAPIAARLYPNLNDAQLSGLIARMANKAYSTIPASQSVIQNRAIREFLRRAFFSLGESEGLLRQATGAIRGPEARYWRRRWIGAYLSLIATANVIHFASTGKPLPAERYTPVSKDKWGPLPFGYNTRFAAPAIPLKGRGGSELTLDIVGQMDTVFRVLNPGFFITSRESVPIRTLVNQVSGTDFFGKPIDDVGPGGIISRLTQLAQDMGAPIGLGGLGTEAIRRYIPGAAKVVTEGEARLGVSGLAIQATGVNVRAETREMRLKRLHGAEAQDTIGKLGQLGQDLGIVSRRLDIDVGIKGGEIELTSEQRDQLQWLTDDTMVKGLQKLFADAEFNALSNSAKQDALSKRMTELRSQARNEFRANLTEARNLLATTLREADDQLGRTIGKVKPFSHEPLDIYDTGGDLDSFYRKKLSNVPRAALVGLDLPPTVQSWYDKEEARKVAGELGGQKLYTINADETKGDTFEDFYNQWQNDKTKGDPRGNISRREFDLLKKYHSLDKEGQAQFLKDNPELARVPQDEWLKSHPKENAVLAIWGEGKLLTQEAYDEAKRLIKELDIPDKALPKFTLPPDKSVKAYFEYQDVMKKLGANSWEAQLIIANDDDLREFLERERIETPVAVLELKIKNRPLYEQYEGFSDKDSEFYIQDSKAREEAVEKLKAENPAWVDDMRRIEVYNAEGDKKTADAWVERGKLVDKFSANSSEIKVWLLDNPEVHQWALTKGLLTDQGDDWNEQVLRINADWREQDKAYNAIEGDKERQAYLEKDAGYATARIQRDGYQLGLADVTEWVEYNQLPLYGKWRERYRAEHGQFDIDVRTAQAASGKDVWADIEPLKIPPVRYDQLYEEWKPQFDAYDNVQGPESQRDDQRKSMLINDPDFRKVFYERKAYEKLVPQKYVNEYVDYYSRVRYMKPANWEIITSQDLWYEDEWFWQEHRDFYMDIWKDLFGNKASDFSTVPSRIVFNKWLKYQPMTRSGRLNFRFNHRDLDAWGVRKWGWTPISRLDR